MASPLALEIYMFVSVNVDALATGKWYWIERKPVVFLCRMQDSNQGSPKTSYFQLEFQSQPCTMLYDVIIIAIEQDYAFISLVQMFLAYVWDCHSKLIFFALIPENTWYHISCYGYNINVPYFSDLNSEPFMTKICQNSVHNANYDLYIICGTGLFYRSWYIAKFVV